MEMPPRTKLVPSSASLAFLDGGGEMGERIRTHDWSRTSLGSPGGWPQGLRTAMRVLLTTRHPIFIFWGPEHICFYNDAYSQSLGPEKHPAMLGAPGRQMWEEIWPIIGPQIETVMAGRGATWHEDHLVPITRHGRREAVYWTYSYGPIDDDSAPAGVGGVLVICTETTAKVQAEERYRAFVANSSEGIWRYELEEPLDLALPVEAQITHLYRYARLAEANDAMARMYGYERAEELLGIPLEQMLPREDPEARAYLRRIVQSGFRLVEVESIERDRTGAVRHFANSMVPEIAEGKLLRAWGVQRDITERKKAAEHRELLIGELAHRVKNTLAVVQSIASQTLRRAGSLEQFREAFVGRIAALAAVHDLLLSSHWEGVELRELIERTLLPYAAPGRVALSGPSVRLSTSAAVSVSMALHELATNAAKYGALSRPGGRIEIAWEKDGTLTLLRLCWREEGGPAIAAEPSHEGFGSRLVAQVARELGAQVQREWRPQGLSCSMVMPLGEQVSFDEP